MLNAEEVTATISSIEMEMCRQIQEGRIYFTETGHVRLLMSSDSLASNDDNRAVI